MALKKNYILLCFCALVFNQINAADFVWYNDNQNQAITYTIENGNAAVVQSALEMWKDDMWQVTGRLPFSLLKKDRTANIRIVQIDKKNSKGLKEEGVPVDSLFAKKEAFLIKVVNKQILVVGSDPRGTAYGILELSRMAGVSPWIWWGDVAPEKKSILTLPNDFYTFQSPSVEFRGIFINDEDWSLTPWSSKNFEPKAKTLFPIEKRFQGQLGPKTYEKIFELLLRLRANTIWPAMHEVTMPFYFVEGNREMAERYGIFIGTSHCEPMMRNSATEWDLVAQGEYNYLTNKNEIQKYWSDRLVELKNSENIFTIGMRGKHDGAMQGVKTTEEYKNALAKIIPDQIKLLKKHINPDVTKIPQQFVPYKEVLDVFDAGLEVPEHIMLTWCDDNYGYLTRLSDTEHQKRKGGAGVYYHLSYWGRPHSYLWLTVTQPGLIYYEMKNAWEHNVRRLWVVNVHDPKIAAYDLELFLDLAWEINKNDNNSSYTTKHLFNWLKREFGTVAAEKLFPAMNEFYRLTAIRKPEFMGWSQIEVSDRKTYPNGRSAVTDTEFSFTEFGGEADRYLSEYRKIKDVVAEVEKIIPENRKDNFFTIIKYPIFGASAMATKWLEAQYARSYGSQSAMDKSISAYNEILSLTDYYNNISNGKWEHSMSYKPQNLPVFEKPNFDIIQEVKQAKKTDNTHQYVVRNACDFTHSSKEVQKIAMLGHSMNAVSLPKGETLTYEFESAMEGDAVLRTAVIPTHPNDMGDIRFSVQIDDETPQEISFREKGRTEQWKINVLRGQAVKTTNHKISRGKHTLKITALDNHIVIDQWMIDFNKDRKFYIFPVSSVF
jgi:hypothetical protein